MAGLFDYEDPESAGRLAFAAGLLNASGPQRMPVSFGQALAQAFMGQQEASTRAAMNRRRNALTDAQIMELQAQAMQRMREKQPPPIISLGGGAYWDVSQGKPFYPPEQQKPEKIPFEYEIDPVTNQIRMRPGVLEAKERIARAGSATAPVPVVTGVDAQGRPQYYTTPTRSGEGMRPTGVTPPATAADVRNEIRKENAKAAADASIATADRVISTIDTALKQVGPMTTGLPGAVLGKVPGFTPYDLRNTIDTIKANLGFQELSAMRQASPTGGALGQIAVRELELLQATIANLDPNQSEKQITANLRKARDHYAKWKSAVLKSQQQSNQSGTGLRKPSEMTDDEIRAELDALRGK